MPTFLSEDLAMLRPQKLLNCPCPNGPGDGIVKGHSTRKRNAFSRTIRTGPALTSSSDCEDNSYDCHMSSIIRANSPSPGITILGL